MTTFVTGFVVMLLAFVAMAAGVLLGRAPIRGSCGGLGSGQGCTQCQRRCARRGTAKQDQ